MIHRHNEWVFEVEANHSAKQGMQTYVRQNLILLGESSKPTRGPPSQWQDLRPIEVMNSIAGGVQMNSWSSNPAYVIEQRISVRVDLPSPQDTDDHGSVAACREAQ